METRIYNRIRDILETTPGLTQKGLAERMGLNPAAVNRMLYGRRNIMAEEIPMIEDYLGVKLHLSVPSAANHEYRQECAASARRGFSDVPAQAAVSADAPAMVPVYGVAGGLQKQMSLSSGNVVDWAVRHPAQFGIVNAFAVYIFADDMAPRYFRGELAYLHPGRPPEINRDCLIEMKNGEALVRRFIGDNGANIRVAQFNPAAEQEIARDDIQAVYAVVGRS